MLAGSTALLESYAKRRKPHNLGMMLGLDVLKATMAAEPGFVSDMRNLGMGVINSVPFLKVGETGGRGGKCSQVWEM